MKVLQNPVMYAHAGRDTRMQQMLHMERNTTNPSVWQEIRGPENAHSTNGKQERKQKKLGMEVNWEQESTVKPKQ